MIKLSEREGRSWAKRLSDPPACHVGELAAEAHPDPVAAVDGAIAAYIAEMRQSFECLRQAEAQLAGLLVLAAASGQAIADHPMLELVSGSLEEAVDGVRSIHAPEAGRQHHAHILHAVRALRLALDAARRCLRRHDEKAVARALAPLRVGHQHLVWATLALPGLEVVKLSDACCAQHAHPPRPTH
jgi:hypothetical protein